MDVKLLQLKVGQATIVNEIFSTVAYSSPLIYNKKFLSCFLRFVSGDWLMDTGNWTISKVTQEQNYS